MSKGPVLIELDDDAPMQSVAEAAPVPEPEGLPEPRAMQAAAAIAARRPSRLGRWFWGLTLAILTAVVTTAAWSFVTGWIAANPILGWMFAALFAAFALVLLVIALGELAALSRLRRIDHVCHAAHEALEQKDLAQARDVVDKVLRLYAAREDTRWQRDRFSELQGDQLDAHGLLALADRELMPALDKAAMREVEAAARQVATVTALVPLALVDVLTALTANLRMIRRIAEIYGGRAGTLGSWRLTRAVMGHLVATGAVAVGDDMLEPILGGTLLGKLSRRFGEGLVNGALTARVGAAALEVCRPLPYVSVDRPRARSLVKGALGGLVSRGGD